MPTTLPRSATRPVLRPGVHVLRRSAEELQVGLDPGRALVLPDSARTRAALAALSSPASAREGYDAHTVGLLDEAGLLVDADTLLPLVPDGPVGQQPGGSARAGVAAVAALAGDDTPEMMAARGRARVQVLTSGSHEARQVASLLARLLADAGICSEPARPEGCGRPCSTRPGTPTTTAVLVSVGEPPRELTDQWVRDATPHLFVRLTEGRAVVGPFVHPGRSACLRCIDAHHRDVDPAWPLLVAQYASAVVRRREDTLPEPVDPILGTLAAAWAARDVVSHAEGRSPATTSTTIRLDPLLTALETQTWPAHPDCGCSWT